MGATSVFIGFSTVLAIIAFALTPGVRGFLFPASSVTPDSVGNQASKVTQPVESEIPSVTDSIGKPPICKPEKPYPEFLLYAPARKRWAKKIKGRTHFFGPWDHWEAAFAENERQASYLHSGRPVPPKQADVLTVGILVNAFLEHRDGLRKSGELTDRYHYDSTRAATCLIDAFWTSCH